MLTFPELLLRINNYIRLCAWVFSFNAHNTLRWMLLSSPLHRQGIGSTERLSNLSNVTQSAGGGAGISSHALSHTVQMLWFYYCTDVTKRSLGSGRCSGSASFRSELEHPKLRKGRGTIPTCPSTSGLFTCSRPALRCSLSLTFWEQETES